MGRDSQALYLFGTWYSRAGTEKIEADQKT
jgi:hypothetical protein